MKLFIDCETENVKEIVEKFFSVSISLGEKVSLLEYTGDKIQYTPDTNDCLCDGDVLVTGAFDKSETFRNIGLECELALSELGSINWMEITRVKVGNSFAFMIKALQPMTHKDKHDAHLFCGILFA